MKFNFLFLVVAILIFVTFVFGASPLSDFSGNFTEGFESGTFTTNNWSSSGGTTTNWVVSTENPRTGTYHTKAENTDGESILSTSVNTSGYGNVNFSFWYLTTGLDPAEYLRADWYNGTGWVNLLNVTATNTDVYTLANFSLDSSASSNSEFAIRFRCDVNSPNEGCQVDDIQVTGEEILGIDLVDIYLINHDDERIYELNSMAAETSDIMFLNFSVNHVDPIDTWYLNYSANGTNACALGNKQSSTCYSYPNWIQFINGTETETFDALKKSPFDYIDAYLSEGILSNFSFIIDEHYNPNVFKWYGVDFNFSDEKWLNDSQYRIGSGNSLKMVINSSMVPADMDFARVDFRVSYNGTPETLEMFACNSSLIDQDPYSYAGCTFIGEKAYSELDENGTKFKAFFTKNLVDKIGDFRYIVLNSQELSSTEYYYIATYGFLNENYSNHWEYSTDSGSTWNKSDLMYDTQMNINWFYAGGDPTAFVYRFFVNTTTGYEEYLEGNLTWDVVPVNNYPPSVVLVLPKILENVALPYNVTFLMSDTNDDDLDVTLSLYKNGTLNKTLFNGIDKDLETYYWNESVVDSEYDLVLNVCEVNTTELYCRNNTRTIFVDNTFPVFNSIYPMVDSSFENIRSLNVSVNISEENLDFVYVNVTYPNSSVLKFDMANYSLNIYNRTLEITDAGNYSLDFFSADLAGNEVSTQSNFTVADTESPNVNVLYPGGQNFSSRQSVEFILNITDFSELDYTYANVTYPNETIRKISSFSCCLESDDFSSDASCDNWDNVSESTASGQSCSMDINDTMEGMMHILVEGNGTEGETYCGFNSKNKIYGDFDMSIEFNASVLEEDSLFVFRSNNIETFSPEGIRVFLLLYRSGGNIVYRIGSSYDGVVNETTVIVNKTHGTFRIQRINSTGIPAFNLFYEQDGSWVNPLGDISLNGSRQTQYVQIYAVSSSPNYGNIEVFLDSFEIGEHNHYIFNSGLYSSDGLYNVSFFVNDSYGNINSTEKTNFNIFLVNHAPSRPFIFSPNVGDYYSGLIEIDWLEVSDEEDDTLQYNITLLNPDDSFNSSIVSNYGDESVSDYTWNSSLVSDGEYDIEIKVFENDTLENYISTDNMGGTFFIDNTNPSVEMISSYYSGGKIYFSVNSSDTNLDNTTVFLYSSSGLVNSYSNNVSSFSGSFPVGAGNYYLNSTAYDLAGNYENTETIGFVVSTSSSSSGSSSGGSSGSYYYLENLPEKGRNFRLHSGQKVKFAIKNETHFLEVINLADNSSRIVIYSDFFEKKLFVGDSWNIDLDGDLVYDLKINLNSIWKGIYANVTILPFSENVFREEELEKILMELNKKSFDLEDDLKFFIDFNNSVDILFPLNLTFKIIDLEGNLLYLEEEVLLRASKKTYSFSDLNLDYGKYLFLTNLSFNNYTLKTFEETLTVGEIKSLITGEVVGGEGGDFNWVLFGIGFVIVFVFVFMVFRKRKRDRG